MSEITWLYLISEGKGGPVKVGVSRNPRARLCNLQCGNSKPLHIYECWRFTSRDAAFRMEQQILRDMGNWVLVGEWICADEAGMAFMIDDEVKGVGPRTAGPCSRTAEYPGAWP